MSGRWLSRACRLIAASQIASPSTSPISREPPRRGCQAPIGRTGYRTGLTACDDLSACDSGCRATILTAVLVGFRPIAISRPLICVAAPGRLGVQRCRDFHDAGPRPRVTPDQRNPCRIRPAAWILCPRFPEPRAGWDPVRGSARRTGLRPRDRSPTCAPGSADGADTSSSWP
jgi:hypothetical protein